MNIDLEQLKKGQRRALAKAITLVESKRDQDRAAAQQVLNELLSDTGNSLRIGISGVPGVGKSTFIEAFGRHLIANGKKVAVLAVDPSSPLRGGSILGDKTRMEKLAREDNAFIRPSPSEGALGGVALRTRETMLLCEAAGYDVILVETVGVGQSEYEVASMVDFFLVLMLPNAGDDLQGIKRGIMELADALVVNKSDGPNQGLAQQTKNHYSNAFHLLQHDGFWKPQILTCSSLENTGIETVWDMILDYQEQGKSHSNEEGLNLFEDKRARQNREWLNALVKDMLEQELKSHPPVQSALPKLRSAVQENSVTPYSAAHQIIQLFLNKQDPS
ncbi:MULTISPECIES: methylmalonyl Co-A mutase-associated GTPase MeaB [unclassified Oleiphilus]|jgi:LAO/AO transport system kinase|uniref:methylmalonyl Co-A mutase-associated GTPase MeaB n=2 Tax=Oleiphilus TaxID=141450 RepID=UPI0007C35C00|nr:MULTISPECIES: methylmalonyl Co-A mutase-associated GTPase MeaB [unclassified Oleiphilus]KZY42783.1 ATPase/protein kinase [Oleiphilus sp. HI0050]KZZ32403.1 ATPase/protein kinase [Oleiphilus sp. HI0086]KZZ32727.1 ATPase/protein kinase [Oleiphilus sp. HI0086]KZZ35359.1 ATPase/protein kinase [Oleiphilus sp. HI0117]KZZ53170.1 ATPase/protein kinase [Oleiphilus sp. HI0123]